MKKSYTSGLLLGSVFLLAAAPQMSSTVKADDTEQKLLENSQTITQLIDKQAQARAQVEAVQAEIHQIETEKQQLTAENEHLNSQSKQLEVEMTALSEKIVARQTSLEEQARAVQTSDTATQYIRTILDSKSISDVIFKISAMNQIMDASQEILKEQQADLAALEDKQLANHQAITTVVTNRDKLAQTEQALKTRQAELEAAKVKLAQELASAENEKAELEAQKAAAEEALRQAQAEEEARKAAQAETEELAKKSAELAQAQLNPQVGMQAQALARDAQALAMQVATAAPVKAPALPNPKGITNAAQSNTYPIGECTWGAKVVAPWVGNYWGNGGQWAASAAAAGFRTGSIPVVGAVASWNDGGYGHVAVVTAVESATRIQVSEANFNGRRYVANHRGWFNPTTAQGVVTYIYPN